MFSTRRDVEPVPRALSHQEIVALVAPLARRGHRVDMAATRRLEGHIVFQGREAASRVCAASGMAPAARPVHRETLTLNCHQAGLRLTRSTASGALTATAIAEGSDAADLLDALERLPATAQCIEGDAFEAALDHRVLPGPRAAPRLLRASVRTRAPAPQVDLTLTVPGGLARSATLELRPGTIPGEAEAGFPDDLFAVLGWAWSPLRRQGNVWRGSVRLGRGGAEARLHEAARHLSRTLAEPPQAFHRRMAPQRWRVLARRSVPLLAWTCVLLLVGFAPLLREAQAALGPALVAVLAAPLLLLAFYLWHSESPRFEWPPFPRPLAAAHW